MIFSFYLKQFLSMMEMFIPAEKANQGKTA